MRVQLEPSGMACTWNSVLSTSGLPLIVSMRLGWPGGYAHRPVRPVRASWANEGCHGAASAPAPLVALRPV